MFEIISLSLISALLFVLSLAFIIKFIINGETIRKEPEQNTYFTILLIICSLFWIASILTVYTGNVLYNSIQKENIESLKHVNNLSNKGE
jgi:hypothetical protein